MPPSSPNQLISISESPLSRSQSYHDLQEFFSQSPGDLSDVEHLESQDSSGTLTQELLLSSPIGSQNLSQLSQEELTQVISNEESPQRLRPRLKRHQQPQDDRLVSMLMNPLRRKRDSQVLELSVIPGKKRKTSKRSAPSERSNFRFRATSLFCTWPQCATPKEVVMENILKMFSDNVLFAVVAEELHQDGNKHLHAVIKFLSQISASSAHFADELSGSHGKYESAKSIKKVLRYVMKDGCFVVHGDVPNCSVGGARSSEDKITVFDEICVKIQKGASIPEIRKEYPKQFMLYRNRILEYHSDIRSELLDSALLPLPQFDLGYYSGCGKKPDKRMYQLHEWLDKNLGKPRVFKQAQLYVHGPSNIGKSYIIEVLKKYVSIYTVPMMENWFNGFVDGQLMFFDEFKGQKQLTYMNLILQGSNVPLPVKNSMVCKSINSPVIICSNYSPEDAYSGVAEKDPVALDAFRNRLLVLDFSAYDPKEFTIKIKIVKPQPELEVEEVFSQPSQ